MTIQALDKKLLLFNFFNWKQVHDFLLLFAEI